MGLNIVEAKMRNNNNRKIRNLKSNLQKEKDL